MKIKCPGCGKTLSIPDTAAGKVVKCPCGKQLRAPARPASAPTSGAAPQQAPQRPAPPAQQRPPAQQGPPAQQRPGAPQPAPQARPQQRPAPQAGGGFDAGMFDELTDQDLQPVAAVSRPGAQPQVVASGGNTQKLLDEQSATAGGMSRNQQFRGELASPWVRLGAILLDNLFISLISTPILVLGMMFGFMAIMGMVAGEDPSTMTEEEQAAFVGTALVAGFAAFSLIALIAYVIPIVVYAVMVTKSGQTIGKKICGIRIVDADTNELPGFVKGVLMRSWVTFFIYNIPLVGLIGICMIFAEGHQCLHDKLAGTKVIKC